MPVVINGTTGITNVNGSAAAPAETGIDTDTGIYYGTNTVGLATNGTNALFIDASQNVGIGTTSPTGFGSVNFHLNGTNPVIHMTTPTSGTTSADGMQIGYSTVDFDMVNWEVGRIGFWTSGAERMRIDSSGNVGIGTTSPASKLDARTSGNGGISGPSTGTWTARVVHNNDASGGNGLSVQNRWAASSSILFECAMGWNGSAAGYYPVFTVDGLGQVIFAPQRTEAMRVDFNGNLLVGTTSTLNSATVCVVSGSGVGLVVRNSTATAGKFWNTPYVNGSNTLYVINQNNTGVYLSDGSTAWAANSDERLKTDLKPIENAAAKVATLRAVTGRFKTDEEGTSRAFLIAQDVQAVLPEAVDATDPERLGVAYADTIPLLVAAIKELKTQNDDLRARVAALEGAK